MTSPLLAEKLQHLHLMVATDAGELELEDPQFGFEPMEKICYINHGQLPGHVERQIVWLPCSPARQARYIKLVNLYQLTWLQEIEVFGYQIE